MRNITTNRISILKLNLLKNVIFMSTEKYTYKILKTVISGD